MYCYTLPSDHFYRSDLKMFLCYSRELIRAHATNYWFVKYMVYKPFIRRGEIIMPEQTSEITEISAPSSEPRKREQSPDNRETDVKNARIHASRLRVAKIKIQTYSPILHASAIWQATLTFFTSRPFANISTHTYVHVSTSIIQISLII